MGGEEREGREGNREDTLMPRASRARLQACSALSPGPGPDPGTQEEPNKWRWTGGPGRAPGAGSPELKQGLLIFASLNFTVYCRRQR